MFILLKNQFSAEVAVASNALFALFAAALWMILRVDRTLRIEDSAEGR
jgi:hypothetical protein